MQAFLAGALLCAGHSCRSENETGGKKTEDTEQAVDSKLPGPARAAAAAARVSPELRKSLAEKGLEPGAPVFLRAFKQEAELEMWVKKPGAEEFVFFRKWRIAAQSGVLGPKLAEGDGQVPEGFYRIGKSGLKPDSKYHLAMNIGYPNVYDRHHKRTGSFIMIHGSRVSIGCLAMTDAKIEEIYTLCAAALENGQPAVSVHIFPFRMTKKRSERESDPRWADFHANLKEGYDAFEKTMIPPEVSVSGGRYVFR